MAEVAEVMARRNDHPGPLSRAHLIVNLTPFSRRVCSQFILLQNVTYRYKCNTTIMSDAAAEPGVPVENQASSIPPAGENSIAKEVQSRVPARLLELARTPDKILLRLNKCVSSIDHI